MRTAVRPGKSAQIRPFLGKTVVQRRQTPLGPSTCDVCIGSQGRATQGWYVLWIISRIRGVQNSKDFADVICEWPLYGQKPLHRQNSVERSGVGPFYGDRPPDNEQQSSACFLPLMIASPLDVFIGCFLATSNEINWCEIDKKRRL